MPVELVAPSDVIEVIRERGGALYVWPHNARGCGGWITLEAATEPPDMVFRRVTVEGIELYAPVEMGLPESLHLELDRRGRVRAFWNGLAWIA
jgi:hypothetical protein